MGFALSTEARAAGYRLAAYETTGSTSADAMARAQAGEAGPLWIVARSQSAGTGRRGSRWETPDGNLAASLLLTTDLPPAIVATLGFVAGLALARALDGCCGDGPTIRIGLDGAQGGRDRFALKWPNDVLADGAKLAGILLGMEELGRGCRAVVIGIGVNIAATPDGLPYPVTSLAALGCATDAEFLFAALTDSWVELERAWDRGRGFGVIRRLWLANAAGLDGAVAVRTGTGVRRGVFETIDDHGQLVVRAADGSRHRVSAGEVHFGAAASATPEALA